MPEKINEADNQTTSERMVMSRRARAVAMVDRRHGYTVDYAPDPAAHRQEYDKQEEDLAYAEAGMGEMDCNIT